MVVRHHTTTSKNTENMKIGGRKRYDKCYDGCNMTRRGMCYEVQSVFLKQIYESSKSVFLKEKNLPKRVLCTVLRVKKF